MLERMRVDWCGDGGMGRTMLREEGKGMCERVLRMMAERGWRDVLNVDFRATGVKDEMITETDDRKSDGEYNKFNLGGVGMSKTYCPNSCRRRQQDFVASSCE